MFVFRAYIPDIEVVPKPSRLSKAKRRLQSDRAQRYLHNQEVLRDEFWLEAMRDKLENGQVFPLDHGPLVMSIIYCMRSNKVIDRSNIEKAIEDALVKATVIDDDKVSTLPDTEYIIIRQGCKEQWLSVTLRPVSKDRMDALIRLVKEIGTYHYERRNQRK